MDSHDDAQLARQAYRELYGKESARRMSVSYHGRLKGYNATVQQTMTTTAFRLSQRLAGCEPEVKIGVMQFLLNRINRTKVESEHIDFYHTFVRKMSDLAPVTRSDPILEASFSRMGEMYFSGMMARPNLVWGRRSVALLGTYTYATDTIMISRVLEEAPEVLLDYVMYHEMLHKKHQFSCSSGRTHSHTPAFKRDEALFWDTQAEEKLKKFLWHARRRRGPAAQEERGREGEKQTLLQRLMGWG